MTTIAGVNPQFLRLEMRRMLRNRRALIFTLIMPPVLFAVAGSSHVSESYGSGNVTGYIMVSMAVYGAMAATTAGGATVAVERALGWSRQLRLTPLRPAAYVVTKIAVAMMLGLLSVFAVFAAGVVFGAHLTMAAWLGCFVLAWLGSLVFAAFGLFMGYLLPSENVMQILGPAMAVLAMAGGLFFPASGWFATLAQFMPTYGVAALARMPFGAETAGTVGLAVVNVAVWAAVFGFGAMTLFRRDTARV